MKLLIPALALFALASPALAQDATAQDNAAAATNQPMPAANTSNMPMCGPGVTDRCQQSEYAENHLTAQTYRGGGKDEEAMGAGGNMRHGRMMMHKRHRAM